MLLLKKQGAPGAVFGIEAAAGNGDVDVRVLIQLATIGVQGAEDADLDTLFSSPAEHGAGGTAKQVVEQRPVVTEKGPQQVGHGKGNVLPVTVGKDMLLFSNPLLRGLHAAGAAGLGFTALTEEAGMGAIRRGATVATNAHGAGTTGEHALDGKFGPVAEIVTVFVEEATPAVIMLE